jgi:ribonuclease HII
MTLCLAGVDEAGRGALAGPVVAAAVIFPDAKHYPDVRDSKRLTALQRARQAEVIQRQAKLWAIALATVEEIDNLNIHHASLLAMKRAIDLLGIEPDYVLVDGNHYPLISTPGRALIKGDSRVSEISAASILAKTARDALMTSLDKTYPGYHFQQHKGYPTEKHLAALSINGISACHRLSYRPVAALLDGRT